MTTITDGHGETAALAERLATTIRDEQLSPREVVAVMAMTLSISLDGQSLPDGAAHTQAIDRPGRSISVTIHDPGSSVPYRLILSATQGRAEAVRAEQAS